MPRRYRKTRGKRRAVKRRGKRKAKASTLRLRTTTVIPDRMFVKLKYADVISRVPGATIDNYVFRGNSLFDPDFTGTGHQPFGYDQWASANQFYQRYRVHAAKAIYKINNDTATGLICSVYPSLQSTSISIMSNALETPRARFKTCGENAGQSITTLSTGLNYTKAVAGMPSISQDDLFTSLYTTSPSRQWYYVFTASSTDGVTNAVYQFSVQLTYFVEFFDRTQIGQS